MHSAGIHHHLVGLLLAVHGVAGRHRLVVLVSSTRLARKIKAVASFRRRRAHMSLGRPLLFDTYLQNENLGLPHEALALVSFEQRRDVLYADLPVVGVDVVVLAVAQENQQEAVHVRVVFLCR